MLIERIELDEPGDGWPFGLPPMAQLAREPLAFRVPVTFLVGENGTGKSTLVEAIADTCKINSEGGKAGTRYASAGPPTPLGAALRSELTVAGLRALKGPRRRRKGFFFRAETLFNLGQNVSGRYGFWDDDLTEQSHGEGFFTVLDSMLKPGGLYLLDEPEAALSFLSCLRLVDVLTDLARAGSQVICATHSPILAATPEADIVQLDADGYHHTTWPELEIVDHWRRFLARPTAYLAPLVGDENRGHRVGR